MRAILGMLLIGATVAALPARACPPPPTPLRPPTPEEIRAASVAYQQQIWGMAKLVFAAEVDPSDDFRRTRVRPIVLAKGDALPKRFTVEDQPYELSPCGDPPGFTLLLKARKDATYLVYSFSGDASAAMILYAIPVDELVDPVALAAIGRR